MPPSHLTYAALLLLSGCICLSVILIAWSRRHAHGAMALIVMMSGTAIWAFTYAIYWLFPNDPAPFFWLDATYLGVAIAPTAFFVFALQLNHLDRWLNKHTIWILALIPILTVIILWTDGYHQLFFAGKRLPTSTDIFEGGVWFWVNIVYSYAMFGLGCVLIYRGYFRQHGIYRKQSLLILLGSIVAPLANLVGFFKFKPFPGLDLTPFSFTISGIFYTFGLLHLSMFEIVPIAKEILINTMKEGMVIVNQADRLVDINQAAMNELGCATQPITGENVDHILEKGPAIRSVWKQREDIHFPVQIETQDSRFLSININPLITRRPALQGWLISWSDITELVVADLRLKQAYQQLETRLAQIEALQADLKEQTIRDPLTGLLNRRFLEETLQKEVPRANRKQSEIVILMIDIDSFKEFNDSWGHPAGDEILKQLAVVMRQTARKEDFVVRMGGEEFLILMSEIPLTIAVNRAEDLRKSVEEHPFQNGTRAIPAHITISIGVAAYPASSSDIQEVIRMADEALYRAKVSGKNGVSQ